MAGAVDVVPLDEQSDGIRLGQFLKLAGLLDTGGEAKSLLATRTVRVNDVVETRRGRHLVRGDQVSVGGRRARVG